MILLPEYSTLLRTANSDDAAFLRSLYNEWGVLAVWQAEPPSATLAKAQVEIFANQSDSPVAVSGYHFIVECEGSPVGVAEILDIDTFSRSATLGVALHPCAETPKGLGTAVHFGLLWFCFKVLGLNRCTGYAKAGNQRVIDVVKRIGFQEEGVIRQARFVLGEFVGLVVLGALAEEFGRDWTTEVSLGDRRA